MQYDLDIGLSMFQLFQLVTCLLIFLQLTLVLGLMHENDNYFYFTGQH